MTLKCIPKNCFQLCVLGHFGLFDVFDFFQNLLSEKNLSIIPEECLDQDTPFLGPDLGPKCLQSLSAICHLMLK